MDRLADWETLATAWELASLSFRYPDETLAQAVRSGQWAEAAREVVVAVCGDVPVAFGESLAELVAFVDGASEMSCDALLHELRAEATRLFVGAPEAACSPYEGVWRAQADGVEALLYVNPHSMAVERFCRACGLGRPEGTNEPLDHVATECELLEVLALRAAGAVSVGASVVADADLPGGSPEAAYEAFVHEHVAQWVPQFVQELRAQARHPFFRAAAEYLAALLEACVVS